MTMKKVNFIINASKIEEFFKLYEDFTKGKLDTNSFQEPNLSKCDFTGYYVFAKQKIVVFKECDFSKYSTKVDIERAIENYIGFASDNRCEDYNLFLHVIKIAPRNLSFIVKEYNAGFYNFGKTLILNKTFFNSGYSVFKTNIAHEAINSFLSDNGDHYFYLCKEGGINSELDYESYKNRKSLPPRFFKWEEAELINYSKLDQGYNQENTVTNFIPIQRVSGIEPVEMAFDITRDNKKYEKIKYNGLTLSEIFENNSFKRRNPRTGNYDNATENYPFITFKLNKENGDVKKIDETRLSDYSFNLKDYGFQCLGRQSLRQFVYEGTDLYSAFEKKLGELKEWGIDDDSKNVKTYIDNKKYLDNYDDSNVLKIINRETRETFFSKIISFSFANSKELFELFMKKMNTSVQIKEITGVYNEDYNIDLMFTFKDENESEHLIVIENKLYASFNENLEKEWYSYFKNEDKEVNSVNNNWFQNSQNNNQNNQLTKYFGIAHVLAEKIKIEENNIHFVILGPEFRKNELSEKRKEYLYGEKYSVVSYNDLKKAIDDFIGGKNSVPQDVMEIIQQLRRAILPYCDSSFLYYQKTMLNRFVKATIKDSKTDNHN